MVQKQISKKMLNIKSPILLLFYNRVDFLKKQINILKKIKTKKIYIHVDGPKDHVDKIKCDNIKKLVKKNNWNSRVEYIFQNKNLGCTPASIYAIDYCFRKEKQLIILEDDCIPNTSFFKFADVLLKKYFKNKKIMGISGSSFYNDNEIKKDTYFFTRIASTWGLALWKRSWDSFDRNITGIERFYDSDYAKTLFNSTHIKDYWFDKFRFSKKNNLKFGWEYIFAYSVFKNKGLFIYPKKNLISNIGHQGVHKIEKDSGLLFNKTHKISKINHPKLIEPNKKIEKLEFDHHLRINYGYFKRFNKLLKKYLYL